MPQTVWPSGQARPLWSILAWGFVDNPPASVDGAAAHMAYLADMHEAHWPEEIERDALDPRRCAWPDHQGCSMTAQTKKA
jgi:hypothetical protein